MYRVEITDRARNGADAAHAWMVEKTLRLLRISGIGGFSSTLRP